jgi:hypothetical protein
MSTHLKASRLASAKVVIWKGLLLLVISVNNCVESAKEYFL